MRESPCLVPYLVHVVLGFHGLAIHDWTFASDDILAQALAQTAINPMGASVFTQGDVNVIFSLPWYLEEDGPEEALRHKSDEEVKPVGVKVVLEISIVNLEYNKTDLLTEEEESSESTLEQLLGNWTVHKDQIIKCNEDSLHRLAQVALRLKKSVLNAPGFMTNLIHEMERLEIEERKAPVYFARVYSHPENKNASRLISTWSVLTGMEEEINYYGPHRPAWYIVLRVLHVCTIFTMVLMLVWSLGGAASSLHDMCLRRGWGWRRPRHRYASANQLASMGRSGSDEEEEGGVLLEMAVQSTPHDRYRGTGLVMKRKGSQLTRGA
jgi:hypothetical protein